MANGSGTVLGGRGNFQNGEYIFKMDNTAASTHNLDPNDSGKTFLVDSTVVRTINLPAPKAGISYKFILTDTTADSPIAATGNLILGGVEAGAAYLTLAGTTIICEAAASVGDNIAFICDGTNWYVSGHTAHDAGFSVS